MKPPKKAFILAAGLGTRLRPLTFHTPKPLIPVWGRPILHHTLHTLKRWGVREVVINVNQHLDAFRAVAHEARDLQINIELSYEPVVLDTGGALRKAQWFFDQEPFWLINGDIVFDVNPQPLLKAFSTTPTPLSVLWCTDQSGPRTVELVWPNDRHHGSGNPTRFTPNTDGASGRVSSFRSNRPGSLGTYTFCGIHLLSPAILDFIPRPEPQSIIAAYTQAMAEGLTILGVAPRRHYWADLGTLESYLAAHNHIHRAVQQPLPGSDLVHPAVWNNSRRFNRAANGIVVVPPDVNIPPNTNLSNTIIWPGSRIGPGTTTRNAVIAGLGLKDLLMRPVPYFPWPLLVFPSLYPRRFTN